MSLGLVNKQYRPSSAPFSDLKRENTYTQDDRIIESKTFTQVRPSYVPNPKTIISCIVGLVLVGAIVAVVVVLVKRDQAANAPNISNGGTASPSTGATTHKGSTIMILSTSTVGTSAPSSGKSSSTSAQPPIISTPVIAPGTAIWSEWGQWTLCAVTCGNGVQTRYRVCQKSSDQDTDCSGEYVEQGLCFTSTCPVYGKWRSWSSWNACDRTCGSGTQLRTRSCLKTSPADLDCVGKETQSQACNTYTCPDCNKTCSSGKLNADCNRCACSTNITGRVVDSDNFPLASVSIAELTTPYTVLIESDSTGSFFLNTTCIGTNILLRKENYQETIVTASTSFIQITMERTVLPYIISEPYSKSRLSGENATLCCAARGSPVVTSYEWFKDGVILDDSLYPHGTSLMLSNLTFIDSGQYNCRANSPIGSIQSESATLLVRDTSSDFCADSYQQKMQTLPEDCVQPGTNTAQYEVGECFSTSCRLDEPSSAETCQKGPSSCCGVSGYRIVTIDCTGYQITLAVVTGCSCQACADEYLYINGNAVGMDSGLPLIYGDIWVNGALETVTNELGEFSFSVPFDVRKLTITARDTYYNQFLDITKVFSIPDNLRGTFKITLRLFHASEPITISSSVENSIYLGNSSSSSAVSVAQIVVPPNSFIYPDGLRYNGTVSASLTFLDPTNRTVLANIPGVFQFTDREGNTQDLDTLGVFGLFFQDRNGNPLTIDGAIDIFLTNDVVAYDPDAVSNYKIWGLSETTGKWEIISTEGESKTRRRRQTGLWIGEVNMGSYSWYNIDKFRNATSYCYFKTRIYDKYNLSVESEMSNIPNYIYLDFPIFRGTSMVSLYGETQYPTKTCYKAICDDDPGFLEVYSWNGNTYKEETLIPANPSNPDINIGLSKTGRDLVNYNVSENGRILRLRFKRADNGPFYTDNEVCKNSSASSNHFRFYFPTSDPDIYTFMKFFDPISIPKNQITNISARVWYPKTTTQLINVCYMKVSLSFMGWYGNWQAIKLRVLSYGGTNILTQGVLFGIREVEISSNSSICIEYKCSGNLHNSQATDNTKIKVFPIISSGIKCNVSLDNLYSQFTMNKNNLGRSVYENFVPIDYLRPETGIFGVPVNPSDWINGKTTASGTCKNSNYSAVAFTCGYDYSGWWW